MLRIIWYPDKLNCIYVTWSVVTSSSISQQTFFYPIPDQPAETKYRVDALQFILWDKLTPMYPPCLLAALIHLSPFSTMSRWIVIFFILRLMIYHYIVFFLGGSCWIYRIITTYCSWYCNSVELGKQTNNRRFDISNLTKKIADNLEQEYYNP